MALPQEFAAVNVINLPLTPAKGRPNPLDRRGNMPKNLDVFSDRVTPNTPGPDRSEDPTMINYEVIKNALHEEIMGEYEKPREIRERTMLLVERFEDSDRFAVQRCANDLAEACRWEVNFQDGDMETVVAKLVAMLAGTVPWLERHGIVSATKTEWLRDFG
jgi:hypothetical protein